MKFSFLRLISVIFSIDRLSAQSENSAIDDLFQCDCMEYWECVGEGGTPYSYCEYSHKVCCFIDVQARKIGILPKRVKTSACGQKGTDSGKDGESEPGEWAWHAAILEKPNDLYVCGGSLLDEHWILTAAHCVDDYTNGNSLKVRLGEYHIALLNEPHPHEEYHVSRLVLHPNFDNETLENDIALVRVRRPVRRKPHINVACLPESGVFEAELLASASCYITGWGRRTENSSHSLVLKEINVPIWRQERCEAALQLQFGTEFIFPKTALCAGGEGRDACDGDGGGPMVCRSKSKWYQVGIISFGIGCGRPNIPGVYTRVTSFSSWIHETIFGVKT